MAGNTNDFHSGAAPFYLDATQQDLLLAALASNNQNTDDLFSVGLDNKDSMGNPQYPHPASNLDTSYFASPTQPTPSTGFTELGMEESPFVGLLDGDGNLDFDNAHGDLMIGSLPGDSPNDLHEKRKNSADDDEDGEDEGGGKRREGEDKQAKKPGRKPLTSEPTTKRKAQNRAAQRAFRERKEKHLKDLETKVNELEKASDATNHENGLLRAQVQRLQVELSEYRKRLSLNSGNLNRIQAPVSNFGSLLNNNNTNNSFSFDFPRFGGLPGAGLLDNGPLSKTKNASMASSASPRQNSTGRSISPTTQLNGSMTNSPGQISGSPAGTNPSRSGSLNSFFGMNSPPTNTNASNNDGFTKSPSRVFQFNSGSSTHSDSPSTSSTSPNAIDSSCGTSPAPSHNSPNQQKDAIGDGYLGLGNPEVFNDKSPAPMLGGIDFFANQNGGQFDPALFGDYRDTQNAIIGDGDFTNGFFNDAFLNTGYGSPFHFGDTPAVQKSNPLEEIERIQNGEEEVVPGEDPSSMLNCHKIWDKLSSRPDFKDGTIDIDNLCSELRAKARCSESGVVVDHKDVEAALQRLPKDSVTL